MNIGTNDRSKTAVRKYRNVSAEHYRGLVWCLTVPTGAYVVRRNGKMTVCGNSAHWANKADLGVTVHRSTDDFGRSYSLVRVWKSKRHDIMGPPVT
jgi:TATA-box binding protein (TBP) (component of TFIID and TFIIIB)